MNRVVVGTFLSLALTVSPVRAQLVTDGASVTLANVTNNITGTVTVGTNGSFTVLELSDNALLTSSLDGVIGRNATATSNEVRLTSGTARWQMGDHLYVGSNGPANRLIVSNGALVVNNFGILGFNASSTHNLALVTGSGSLWSNVNFAIGWSGRNNRMIVSNGGWVTSHSGPLGAASATSTDNSALITGAGSVWNNTTAVTVGAVASFNRLAIEDGGLVRSRTAVVGSSSAASDNDALVTGPASQWNVETDVTVGSQSGRNRLVVSNGAAVVSGGNAFIGLLVAASNNVATIAGAGSMWSNAFGFFTVGNSSPGNQLNVSDGGQLITGDGGLGFTAGANNNTAVLSGSGTLWNNLRGLTVGESGSGSLLLISNGATVLSSNLFVGINSASANNRVVVNAGTLRVTNAPGTSVLDVRRGTNVLSAGLIEADRLLLTNAAGRFEFLGGTLVTRGALVTNGSGMVIGAGGTNPAVWDVRPGAFNHVLAHGVVVGNSSSLNQLLVTVGALLTNNVGGFIGFATGANSNAATVSGPGSRWRVAGDVFVGAGGAFNQLTVTDGGLVGAVSGRVGASQSSSSNNMALVSGAGSVWSNAASLIVGEVAPGNQLVVNDGGVVFAANGQIGQGAAANTNSVFISEAGSRWQLTGNLDVGIGGSRNELWVSDGAQVSNTAGSVGNGTGTNNLAVVTGAGSVWNSASSLSISQGSQLVVSNGGMVITPFGDLGATSSNSQAVVTGPGSVWDNSVNLNVGFFGKGNRLTVQNGGLLGCGTSSIGVSGDSNAVIVTGAGSVWSNKLDQIVGDGSRGNELIVGAGGTAFTGGNARIGFQTSASSNVVTTTDPGSRWLVVSNLSIGDQGSFNSLVVSNGAFATALTSFVGYESTSSNNLALVTGVGSTWSNALNGIRVGLNGSGNRLVVTNGGFVDSPEGALGYQFGSDQNQAVVTGPGSVWNAGSLRVGFIGSSNRLLVANGGRVVSTDSEIGTIGQSNEVTITGSESLWTNQFNLTVGTQGGNNRLRVESGGTVLASNIFVGESPGSTNNRVLVNGGTLRATNSTGTGALDVRRGTNVLNAGLVDVDRLMLTNAVNSAPITYLSSDFTSIPSSGPATPYPSTITVGGQGGTITAITVTLSNLSHQFCTDLDILLVSPDGQKVMLMSDAGGNNPIPNRNLTFDDHAATFVSQTSAPVSGNYRPTDYLPADSLAAPAPAGPYSPTLSSFNGINPNGVWSLYIFDDIMTGTGSMSGWSLRITTDAPTPAMFELNGGTLITRGAVVSYELPFIVGGAGGVPAIWEARAGLIDNFVVPDLLVGNNSSFNQLLIPSGIVVAGTNVIVGASPPVSTNNLLHITGGTLRVLTPGAALDVRGGTNRLDAGLVDVLHLVVTNASGQFEFNGGTLRTPDTTIANGRVFTVGGGASLATLQLLGGTHSFANNLTIATNGSLIGTGLIDGTVTVAPGGRLTPGAPIGNIDVQGSVILQGTVNLQIDKSGGVRTSDEVTADGAMFYNGTLNVTDIGADVLSVGDRFFLFDATPYIGSFTTLNLPPLGPGLAWQNDLSVDGSIEVVAASVSQPKFSSITHSGNNVILSGTNGTAGANYAVLTTTNVTLPSSNWVSLITNQFGAGGAFSFTNPITPGELQRYFRLRTP